MCESFLECIQELKDEVARLKGEKGKPKIKPSRLEPKGKAPKPEADTQESKGEESQKKKKRPGSEKRHKTADLTIHETKLIQPTQEIPPGSEFKGYQDYTVQELMNGLRGLRLRHRRTASTFWNS